MDKCSTLVAIREQPRISDLQRLLVSYFFARKRNQKCGIFLLPGSHKKSLEKILDWLGLDTNSLFLDVIPEEQFSKRETELNQRGKLTKDKEVPGISLLPADESIWPLLDLPGTSSELVSEARERTTVSNLIVRDNLGQFSASFCQAVAVDYLNPEGVFSELYDLKEPFYVSLVSSSLDHPLPTFYIFIALRASSGEVLSHSDEDLDVTTLLEQGFSSSGVALYLMKKTGVVPDLLESPYANMDELEKSFRLDFIGSPQVDRNFSIEELIKSSGYFIRRTDVSELLKPVKRGLAEYSALPPSDEDLHLAIQKMLPSAGTLTQLTHFIGLYLGCCQPLSALNPWYREILLQKFCWDALDQIIDKHEREPETDLFSILDTQFSGRIAGGSTARPLPHYPMIHLAVNGHEVGPTLRDWSDIVGQKQVFDLIHQRYGQIEGEIQGDMLLSQSKLDMLHDRLYRQLEEAVVSAERQRNHVFLLRGKRGFGRSYLVKMLCDRLDKARFIAISLDLSKMEDYARLPIHWVNEMTDAVCSFLAPEQIHGEVTIHDRDKTWSSIGSRLNAHLREVPKEVHFVVGLSRLDTLNDKNIEDLISRCHKLLAHVAAQHIGRLILVLTLDATWKYELPDLDELRMMADVHILSVGSAPEEMVLGSCYNELQKLLPQNAVDRRKILTKLAFWIGGNPTCAYKTIAVLEKEKEALSPSSMDNRFYYKITQNLDRYFKNLWNSLNDLEKIVVYGQTRIYERATAHFSRSGFPEDFFEYYNRQVELSLKTEPLNLHFFAFFPGEEYCEICIHLERFGVLRTKKVENYVSYLPFSPIFAKWVLKLQQKALIANAAGSLLQTIPLEHILKLKEDLGSVLFEARPGLEETAKALRKLGDAKTNAQELRVRQQIIRSLLSNRVGLWGLRSNPETSMMELESKDPYFPSSFKNLNVILVREDKNLKKSVLHIVEDIHKLKVRHPLIIFFLGKYTDLLIKCLHDQGVEDFCVLNADEMREILFESKERVLPVLRRFLLKHFGGHLFNPYQTGGVLTNPAMFVGRLGEIEECKSKRPQAFFILGGRVIGKSSMMLKMLYDECGGDGGGDKGSSRITQRPRRLSQLFHRASRLRKERRGVGCYFDVEGLKAVSSFLGAIHESYRLFPDEIRPSRSFNTTQEFSIWLERLLEDYDCVYIFFDEIDDLLKNDLENTREMLKQLRRILQIHDNLVLGISGRSLLYKEIGVHKSPCYNLSTIPIIWLSTLDRKSALDLVRIPMRSFDLEIDKELYKKIVDDCLCHPQLIQLVCHRILASGEVHRRLDYSVAKHILSGSEFKTARERRFLGALGKAEFAILNLLIVSHIEDFSESGLWGRLNNPRANWPFSEEIGELNRLREALQNLQLASILRVDEGRYRWAVPQARNLIREYITNQVSIYDK